MFCAEKIYTLMAGMWYFASKAVMAGEMGVGWSRPDCQPDQELGSGKYAFASDGFVVSDFCWGRYGL